MPSKTADRATSRDESYPRTERVCLRRDYDRAYQSRLRAGTRTLVLHGVANGLDHCRFGMTVSRRVGGAVVRNLVKRRLRDIYRRNRSSFPVGMDIVAGIRPSAAIASFTELQADVMLGLRRLQKAVQGE